MPIRFQVDADFYDHPKTTGMSDSAFALWVRAGSFCAAKHTDGFVSEDVLAHTLRYDAAVADELVRRRLWRRVKGGYRFHEWDDRNLTKARIEADRKADRQRKARSRSGGPQTAGQNGNPQANPANVRTESQRSPEGIPAESERIPGVSVSVSVSESVSGSGHGHATRDGAGPEPPGPRPQPACREHQDDPDPPACRRCKTAREAAEAWDQAYATTHAMAEAHHRDQRPQCQRHRGQLAHNCALCRSEALAVPEPLPANVIHIADRKIP